MKKRNVILHAAIASAMLVMFGAAQATTVSATAPVFAKELLQGSTPNATALTMPTITVVANTSIPANSTVYVYVKLNGASISTMPTATGIALTQISDADGTNTAAAGAGLLLTAAKSAGTTTGTVNPAAVGAGVDYVVFQLQTNAAVVGVGGTVATITGLAVNNATALLTAPITATASVGVGAPASRFGALAASATNHDATSPAANVATSAQGITLATAASTNAGKIDLTVTPSATLFDANAINTNTLKLGTILATDSTAKQADGTTAYTIATQVGAANKLTAVLTAPAGFFAPLGTTGQLWLENTTCSAAGATGAAAGAALAGSPSTAFTTTALAAAATTVTLTATAAPTTATAVNVCMGITKTIAANEGTPTVVATLIHTGTAVDSNETASGSLYALVKNGTTRDVRSYIPAATVGYTSFVRVINTGTLAAPVTGQWLYEDGTASTAATLIASHPAGGSTTLTSTQVEAALGAPAAIGSDRPRLRLTAPTNGLEAQSFFLTNANGNFSDATGGQL